MNGFRLTYRALMKSKNKLNKAHIITIVSTAVVCIAAVAIIITNLFIPVKYLSAYIIFSQDKAAAGTLRVSFIDVGYGDSTLIELPDGKTALIDAGNGSRACEINILKLLNRRGIDKIDYLVCSSVSEKRCGGLAEILKYKKVGKVFAPDCKLTRINDSYRAFCGELNKAAADSRKVETATCGYGEIAFAENYSLCFLSPSVSAFEGNEYDDLNKNPSDENIANSSAVIWLEFSGAGFLLAGDINSVKADRLCSEYKLNGYFEIGGRKIDLNACKVLKVGANGSKSSASPLLYDLLKPETAIISVGENGSGCPSAETFMQVQKYVGDKIYSTQDCGTLTVEVGGGNCTVFKEKK